MLNRFCYEKHNNISQLIFSLLEAVVMGAMEEEKEQ
jgi:hypothetical protein